MGCCYGQKKGCGNLAFSITCEDFVLFKLMWMWLHNFDIYWKPMLCTLSFMNFAKVYNSIHYNAYFIIMPSSLVFMKKKEKKEKLWKLYILSTYKTPLENLLLIIQLNYVFLWNICKNGSFTCPKKKKLFYFKPKKNPKNELPNF